MPPHTGPRTQATDLDALDAVTAAVEDGAGLPEIVRAAGRALDASLVLIDRAGSVLAVAARSPADERSLMRDGDDVRAIDLRVAETVVGQLRMRAREGEPEVAVQRLVTTLVASEVERLRAPERASAEATTAFLRAAMAGEVAGRADLVARGEELGLDLAHGISVVVARAHPRVPVEEDWRPRLLAVAERGARSAVPGTLVSPAPEDAGELAIVVPDADGEAGRRVAETVRRELEAGLHGFSFALGRSRHAADPAGLARAAKEALLAANVVEGDEARTLLAFEDTGAYRLLLGAMSEDPSELRGFYSDTVEPLIAYDEQYETNLVGTLETFLECDGNVQATAAKLFTHRHTVRYRLERARELSGLDVGSTDGREKLSLGLKAMRVLGIAAPRGPATEHGAEAGRVGRERTPGRS
ncbi:MAG: helix-turn-helix domain-containing protein [Solirubrobacteraceae bacterium]